MPHRPTLREALTAALLTVTVVAATPGLAASPTSPHPVVDELVTKGFAVAVENPKEKYRVTAPLFATGDDAKTQKAKLTKLVGARGLDRFLRDSPVAPQVIKVGTAGSVSGDAKVRTIDLYFAAHGSLKLIEEKQLLSNVAKSESGDEGPFDTYVKTRDGQELGPGAPERPEPTDPEAPAVYRFRTPVLEKVVVSGMVEAQSKEGPGLLVESAVTRPSLLKDQAEPTVWRPIPRDAQSDADLGPPEPFAGIASYMQATELKFAPGVVLVEAHLVFVEPRGWFNGANLLGSKLPILLQNNVRSFRRGLAKAQAEAKKAG